MYINFKNYLFFCQLYLCILKLSVNRICFFFLFIYLNVEHAVTTRFVSRNTQVHNYGFSRSVHVLRLS